MLNILPSDYIILNYKFKLSMQLSFYNLISRIKCMKTKHRIQECNRNNLTSFNFASIYLLEFLSIHFLIIYSMLKITSDIFRMILIPTTD